MSFRTWFRWGWLLAVVGLGAGILWPVGRGWVSRSLVWSGQPVVVAGHWIGDHWQLGLANRQNNRARQDLQRQLEEVTSRLYETNQQLETTRALVALDDFSQASKLRLITASVLASSPDLGVRSVVINHGSDAGLKIGQAVVSDNGYLTGKIVAIHQATSTVLLITDRQSVTAARVQNDDQSPGVIRGERGLSLQMEFIPKNDLLRPGQTVVTSGTESLIPPNLLIGTLASITTRSADLFQQAVITPSSELQSLRVVAVVIQ